MNEVMSLQEIEAAFDGEWVLIEDPELTSSPEILGGKVVFHGKDKDMLHQKTRELGPISCAIIYVGDAPEDLVYALACQSGERE